MSTLLSGVGRALRQHRLREFSTNVNSRIQRVQESFFKPVRAPARLSLRSDCGAL